MIGVPVYILLARKSRVGGKTQAHALREVAETVHLDYAQFLELGMFTRCSPVLAGCRTHGFAIS
jgi:F0F1-type ATP synthase alpha subunit